MHYLQQHWLALALPTFACVLHWQIPFGIPSRNGDLSISSRSAGFFKSSTKMFPCRPGPIRLSACSNIQNFLVFSLLGVRPGFNQHDERGAGHSVGELELMSG